MTASSLDLTAGEGMDVVPLAVPEAVGAPGASDPAESSGTDKRAARIARLLEDEIVDRGWPVGELLGSESDLRERFGVSRSVLREAVRLLEHHQVGRMRRGPNGGLFVAAPDAGPATRALVIYLEFVGTSVEHLLEARLLLEPLAARLAAESVTEEGIERLRQALDTERTRRDFWNLDPDDDLHVMLGRLSGNAVLQLFTEVLLRLTFRYAQTSQRTSKEARFAVKTDAHARHAEIVDAVIAGDAAAAETRLNEHLQETASWLMAHRARRQASPPRKPATESAAGSGRKLAEVVADRIHDDIAANGREIGDVLGSEADLLRRYGVSRAVLREAVRLLEHHSVARMRRGPGGGLVVQTPDPTASVHTIALYLDHQGLSPTELRVVREAIELGCVQAVTAARSTTETAERLRTAIDRAAEHGDSGDVFHTELAELAGNPVLSLFLQIITQLWARHSRTERPASPTVGDEVRRVHDKILDAVLSGDDGLAQHRMRRHLQALTAWWH